MRSHKYVVILSKGMTLIPIWSIWYGIYDTFDTNLINMIRDIWSIGTTFFCFFLHSSYILQIPFIRSKPLQTPANLFSMYEIRTWRSPMHSCLLHNVYLLACKNQHVPIHSICFSPLDQLQPYITTLCATVENKFPHSVCFTNVLTSKMYLWDVLHLIRPILIS